MTMEQSARIAALEAEVKLLEDSYSALLEIRRDKYDAADHFRVLADDATPGPYCMFGDDGHAVSVMPAGRPGDVCKVDGCVNPDGDAAWITWTTPERVVGVLDQRDDAAADNVRVREVVRRGLALVDSINRVEAYSDAERSLANNWLDDARAVLGSKAPKV